MNHTVTLSAATLVCPACDKDGVVETWGNDYFVHGVGNPVTLTAYVPFCHCCSCGLEYTDVRAEEIRHATVCQHLHPPLAV